MVTSCSTMCSCFPNGSAGCTKGGAPLETRKSRLTSTSMRLDTSCPVRQTSASTADVQHSSPPLLAPRPLRAHGPWASQAASLTAQCSVSCGVIAKDQASRCDPLGRHI